MESAKAKLCVSIAGTSNIECSQWTELDVLPN